MKNSIAVFNITLAIVLMLQPVTVLSTNISITKELSSEKRTLEEFNKLDISGAYKVILIQGEEHHVSLEGSASGMADVVTKVDKGTLKIYNKNKSVKSENITLTVAFKDLKKIDCSGAIVLSSEATLKFNTLELDFSGACKSELSITADKVDVDISGTGNIALTGKADQGEVEISGTGKFQATGFVMNSCKLEISGVAQASVHAVTLLDVSVSGTGNVSYKGDPQIKKNITGTGTLKKL